MIKIEDILSLTEFHRRTREHIARLRATGRPEVLTINGRAELVVQDASAYQHLLERLKRYEGADEENSKRKTRKIR
jgi:PHD/YefM family antitoxin component YafN of YafNO toxin-antitoxin module